MEKQNIGPVRCFDCANCSKVAKPTDSGFVIMPIGNCTAKDSAANMGVKSMAEVTMSQTFNQCDYYIPEIGYK